MEWVDLSQEIPPRTRSRPARSQADERPIRPATAAQLSALLEGTQEQLTHGCGSKKMVSQWNPGGNMDQNLRFAPPV